MRAEPQLRRHGGAKCQKPAKNKILKIREIDGSLELVSKELNHLAAILHVYAGGLNFMK